MRHSRFLSLVLASWVASASMGAGLSTKRESFPDGSEFEGVGIVRTSRFG